MNKMQKIEQHLKTRRKPATYQAIANSLKIDIKYVRRIIADFSKQGKIRKIHVPVRSKTSGRQTYNKHIEWVKENIHKNTNVSSTNGSTSLGVSEIDIKYLQNENQALQKICNTLKMELDIVKKILNTKFPNEYDNLVNKVLLNKKMVTKEINKVTNDIPDLKQLLKMNKKQLDSLIKKYDINLKLVRSNEDKSKMIYYFKLYNENGLNWDSKVKLMTVVRKLKDNSIKF